VGVNRNLGLNLNIRLNPSPAFSLGINAHLSRIWMKGAYNGTVYSNQGYTGYASGNVTLQGHSEGRVSTALFATKDVWKKKGTITVAANNVYAKYLTLRSVSSGPDFSQVTENQAYYRSFFIRFNYRFGRLNSEIKKNQHGINNNDIKSGDSN
jgi:hypothetical protein